MFTHALASPPRPRLNAGACLFYPRLKALWGAGERRGLSLIEVLISMAVLLIGMIAILNFFPQSLRANAGAAAKAQAALLAQGKVEELRRDRTRMQNLIYETRYLRVPTDPIPFAENPKLTYSFCGVSLVDPVDSPDDPRDDFGVARIVVRYSASFRPSQDILYELRFAE